MKNPPSSPSGPAVDNALSSNTISTVAHVFAGGGKMGALMRAFDWEKTSLGPVEGWPQSLRTSVNTCLNSRFAILIWWGQDLSMLYNDRYGEIIAAKHPFALGRPGREVWPEIWHIIGPMLHGVLDRGEATWSDDLMLLLERDGYPEECYFTFSYSPIRDESGEIRGVFTPVAETTEHVIGERRLSTLRDLATRSSAAENTEEACRAAAETLAGNPKDVPFAAIYIYSDDRRSARLVSSAGIEPNHPASPAAISFTGDSPSVLARAAALNSPELMLDLARQLGPLPAGAWDVACESGIVLPFSLPGQSLPAGFILAGISPRKRLDAGYRTFLDLLAGQIATAVAEARAYEEEKKRAEALAELDRVKTAFFSNVSHEFRTPLTLMLGPLEALLSRDLGGIDGVRQELELVHRNALRLLKLVNTLLDFSRIEAGRVDAWYEPVDLSAFTCDLASLFHSAIERAGLRFIIDCPPVPERAYVDPAMWEKIVLNLLSNALKFTLSGEIILSLRAAGHNVELSVRDTGTGIAEQNLPRLFDRFQRITDARGRSTEGSGIGLALVQELVKLHGGTLRVQSTLGVGSTFTVSIPLGHAHLPPERVRPARAQIAPALDVEPYVEEALGWIGKLGLPAPPPYIAPSRPPARPKPHAPLARILLVDDNHDMLAYVERLLADRYDVLPVRDGNAALSAALEHPPDLVVSDIMMPGLDGLELVRALRSDRRTATVPVILLSARAGEESRLEGLQAGADDYLEKPFSAREFLARVASHLAISRMRREAAQRERELRELAERERQRWHDVLQRAPALIAILRGPQHTYEMVNDVYLRVTGRKSPLEFVGKTVHEALPELQGHGIHDILESVYRTGSPYVGKEVEILLDRSGNGNPEKVYFNFVYQPERDASGNVDAILVHAVDVTPEVEARQRVEQSEKRLSAIFNQASVGITQCDLTGRFVLTNQKFCDIVGRSIPELYNYRIQDLTHPADIQRNVELFNALINGGPPYSIEKRYIKPDGSIVWVLVTVTPVRDEAECTQYILGITQDITDRRQAEDELRRVNEDLRQFAFAASHDLQEPLRMITAYTELLLKSYQGQFDENATLFARFIREGAQRMRDLLHDLLAYTAISGLDEHPHEIDTRRVIEDVLQTLAPAIQETNAIIEIGSLPRLQAQEAYVGQLFQNLISNAIKYRSAAPPRIHIGVDRRGNHWLFSVRDNGIGIDPRYHDRIFGVFKRLHGKDIPGTGIGLAICQRVVERYGGRIWVEAAPGKGSTFFFTWPTSAKREPSHITASEPPEQNGNVGPAATLS